MVCFYRYYKFSSTWGGGQFSEGHVGIVFAFLRLLALFHLLFVSFLLLFILLAPFLLLFFGLVFGAFYLIFGRCFGGLGSTETGLRGGITIGAKTIRVEIVDKATFVLADNGLHRHIVLTSARGAQYESR